MIRPANPLKSLKEEAKNYASNAEVRNRRISQLQDKNNPVPKRRTKSKAEIAICFK
jgi:hypothetical protein